MEDTIRINSGIAGTDDKDVFQISRFAIDAIKEAIQENQVPEEYYVRIATEAGGCCGLNFYIEFDNEYDPTRDRIVEEMGLKLVIDNETIFQLLGITLDFESTEEDEGFIFKGFRNNDACDCGSDHHHHH